MNLIDAKFLQSAQSLNDSPPPSVAEVAFLGRSNVGKSSILNSLTNQRNLAKSSSTPGKTQLINYFEIKFKTISEETPYVYARFVDLPGFGYAKVAKSLKAAWNRNLTEYLEQRPNLQIFVHLIDSRHPNLEIDKNVDEFLKSIKRGDQIIINAFTKIDKLNSSELGILKRDNPDGIFLSNLKKKGIIDLQNKITEYLFGN
ncbi:MULTISPECIES: ribosome biogenesis GTP-binding protein YihA/YsxC [Aliarcobacter]|jgi:GTP-binding protein|uniref:Probable GTP-binding protein EngB n=1 Tax=Aliarcobacter skirrowii CCUG 10374 TaxID=1032239 RepID=A0AAD0SKT5_9BACT|nr:ribosome biogenesis GTP-binding protein YihA/YsxC [Aliarcobacter skirrowii]AXX84470.1 ribosome biogenesis GTP-binding protein YsxC/EngB [Aliarcobacter skirrowii CCUG 10374]KAB0621357.1 YihA family ribosome biogenesis GTP-binding protein [Aliarcobacter skirrowii CCUG 10374]MDD2508101.1 ribosome biogenesis GTP-binding protein YihA/YsxC [Aliarcobacter skirrowii]MDD3496211.1 ribosome biogenesis GTP-binding protein YihA/YsxC [Aliarcobacter skirrowii]MDX4027458.1 ribosome biogenesis GTP-binding p